MPDRIPHVTINVDEAQDHDLVALQHLQGPWDLDIRYATDDNIAGKKIYSFAYCFLRAGTARKLRAAAEKLMRQDGYRLVIMDGYRPPSAQAELWNAVPDPDFVAPPEKGSVHTRGAAVDVTLADSSGRLLEMPTGFDDFTEQAHARYEGLSKAVYRRRTQLQNRMTEAGFVLLPSEWWHFADADWEGYELLDLEPEQLEHRLKAGGS